jgi:hypothetical protein
MNAERSEQAETGRSSNDLGHVLEEIERAIRGVNYGSVEVVIQNSRVVQIERKEKFRFGGS